MRINVRTVCAEAIKPWVTAKTYNAPMLECKNNPTLTIRYH